MNKPIMNRLFTEAAQEKMFTLSQNEIICILNSKITFSST
jgi:hypothetical protein